MRVDFAVKPEEAGGRLGPFLRRQGLSASLIRQLKYQPEGLLIEGQHAKTNQILGAGQRVSITLPEEPLPLAQPEDIPLEVLYESPHALVLNKPAGLVMHPTRSHKSGTLANAFAQYRQDRAGSSVFRPVGRLDADTSGLVLCAMNAFAAPYLFASMKKEYRAIASGFVKSDGVVDAPLGPAEDSVIRQMVREDGKPSRTHYHVLAATSAWSLLALQLETGRTHQIRAHMAYLGHPLLGDSLYGGPCEVMHRHALHCAAIAFCEPQGQPLRVTAPLPSDIQAVLAVGDVPWVGVGENGLACQTFDTNV